MFLFDEGSYKYWRDMAARCKRRAPLDDDIPKIRTTERRHTSTSPTSSRSSTRKHVPDFLSSVYTGLLTAALGEIDRDAIGRELLGD